MAMNPVDFPNTTSNPAQALAQIWEEIAQIDNEDLEIHRREEAAQERRDELEAAVLAMEPRSAEEAMSHSHARSARAMGQADGHPLVRVAGRRQMVQARHLYVQEKARQVDGGC